MLSQGKLGKKNVPHIQLCDFGLTKVHDNFFGLSTNFTTTKRFEAPELRITKTFTSASDMYAFGGVLLQVRPCSSAQIISIAYIRIPRSSIRCTHFPRWSRQKFPRLTTMQRHPGTSRSPTMSRHPIGRSCENVGRKLQQIDLTQVLRFEN